MRFAKRRSHLVGLAVGGRETWMMVNLCGAARQCARAAICFTEKIIARRGDNVLRRLMYWAW